jgi:hypothetical protein
MTQTTSIDFQKAPSTRNDAHAQFENLAPELLLMIINHIQDLVSLDSLLRSSPAIYRLFESNAVSITEAVLSFGHIHGHTRVMIRIIALIRSSTLPKPLQNLQEFRRCVTYNALNNRVRPMKDGLSPSYLSEDTTPAVLRSILASARRIECLSLDCLEHYLSRFRALRPETPGGRPPRSYCPPKGFIGWKEAAQPEGKKYEVEDVGPPSWVEEQRVIRAFWRVQVWYDLQKAVACSMLEWPEKGVPVLRRSPWVLYKGSPLHQTAGPRGQGGSRVDHEFQEISSIVEYIQEIQGEDDERHFLRGAQALLDTEPREVKRKWPAPVPGPKDWLEVTWVAPASLFHFYTVYSFNNIAPWRRFGFAFWSESRLSGYGFLNPDFCKGGIQRRTNWIFHYVWRSILK